MSDIRYALRALARYRSFSIVAIVTLAIGIGANSAIFGLIDAVMLRPLPHIAQPHRLVWISTLTASGRMQPVSFLDYTDYQQQTSVFSDAAIFTVMPVNLAAPGAEPERARGQLVSGNYFAVLGVGAAPGRTFAPEEDRTPLAHPVAVISHALWQRRFGGDAGVVGRSIVINSHPFTIVGVAPAGFVGAATGEEPDLWIPAMMQAWALPRERNLLTSRDASMFQMVARLKPAVSVGEADAAVRTVARRIAVEHPTSREGFSARASQLSGGLRPANQSEAIPMAALGLGVTGIVLLIACANVANLLLARASARRREIGIRLALGASRRRLVRQLLTESMVLATVGGALGVLLATWTLELLVRFLQLPLLLDLSVNGHVLAWTLGIAIVTGMTFGLVPALQATRTALTPALKDDALAGGSGRRTRTQSTFIIAQMALSLMLLACAGLLLRSLTHANTVDVGIPAKDHIAALSIDLTAQGYSPEKTAAFYEELVRQARELPDVQSASLASMVPFSGTMVGSGVETDDKRGLMAFQNDIWPGYFATLGIPLVAGRDFTTSDRDGAPAVAIVNEALARQLFSGASPVGRRLHLSDAANAPAFEIVGVAHDSKYDELTESPRPYLYFPRLQHAGWSPSMTLLVRAAHDPTALIAPLKDRVRALDPSLALFDVQTLRQYIELRIDKERATARLLAVFGALALGLAAVGMYGVMAFAVAQRTREIGVRIALGARTADVLALVLGDGGRLALIGIGVGLAFALAAAQVIRSLLIGVGPADVTTFAAVGLLLAGVALAASYIPARRAMRVDPAVALRND